MKMVPWTPFQRAALTEQDLEFFRKYGEVWEEVWLNSRYQVLVNRNAQVGPGWPPMIWLSIRMLNRGPIRVWRDLQRIKNELVGPEHEGVELFPAESRLVDTSNQFSVFVLATPGIRFPFGYEGRAVVDGSSGKSVQEPFEERPTDCLTAEEADRAMEEAARRTGREA